MMSRWSYLITVWVKSSTPEFDSRGTNSISANLLNLLINCVDVKSIFQRWKSLKLHVQYEFEIKKQLSFCFDLNYYHGCPNRSLEDPPLVFSFPETLKMDLNSYKFG